MLRSVCHIPYWLFYGQFLGLTWSVNGKSVKHNNAVVHQFGCRWTRCWRHQVARRTDSRLDPSDDRSSSQRSRPETDYCSHLICLLTESQHQPACITPPLSSDVG